MNDSDLMGRYKKAQEYMQGMLTNKLVRNDTVFPHWISFKGQPERQCFWYQRQTKEGREYRFVDVDCHTNVPAFDHGTMAVALNKKLRSIAVDDQRKETTKRIFDPCNLPIKSLRIVGAHGKDAVDVYFQALNRSWLLRNGESDIEEVEFTMEGISSPDGKKIAYIRDFNIWMSNLTTGEDCALTQDGVENFSYGHHLDGKDTLLWSPDSQYLLVARLDRQSVRTVAHVNYGQKTCDGWHPQVRESKRSYPGDLHIPEISLYCIHIKTGHVQKANYPPICTMYCGVVGSGFFDAGLGWWSSDNRKAFFVHASRDSRIIQVIEWDTRSGDTRKIFEERDDLVVRLRHELVSLPLIVPIPDTDELIWFSERSGWGHLYLYDLASGDLKHQVTGVEGSGDWLVREILHYDSESRDLVLKTSGRDPNIDPYYRDICKVNIDTGRITSIASGDFDMVVHQPRGTNSEIYTQFEKISTESRPSGISPTGRYLVATRSRADSIPVSLVIDRDGRELFTIEAADVSDLPDNWQWPEPVKLKASDNTTDIYAVVYRPSGFSPDKSYPVIDFISSIRGISAYSSGSFSNGPFCGNDYFGAAALAELGFIVVSIHGRGTPCRSKDFFTHHYGDQAFTSDLSDRIAGLQQLGKRYPYMDLDRAGISANENPSNNAIYASLLYSSFYKVTVIHCMPDPRFWEASLSEAFEGSSLSGLHDRTPYPEECVDTFGGKLLLVLGMGQWAFHQPTFLLVDALKNANKDFDMLCLPNVQHQVCAYAQRREWDYFVAHLQGGKPPKQFKLIRGEDLAKLE